MEFERARRREPTRGTWWQSAVRIRDVLDPGQGLDALGEAEGRNGEESDLLERLFRQALLQGTAGGGVDRTFREGADRQRELHEPGGAAIDGTRLRARPAQRRIGPPDLGI